MAQHESELVIDQYFRKKGCEYWKEQEPAYGSIDFKERTVVIVGADCGTTVIYALLKGAKLVIAFEKDDKLRAELENTLKDYGVPSQKVIIHGEWLGNYPKGDVFIQDCEGCEIADNFSEISKYEQVCIAVHLWIDFAKLMPNLIGYRVTYVTPDFKEIVLCKTGLKSPNT